MIWCKMVFTCPPVGGQVSDPLPFNFFFPIFFTCPPKKNWWASKFFTYDLVKNGIYLPTTWWASKWWASKFPFLVSRVLTKAEGCFPSEILTLLVDLSSANIGRICLLSKTLHLIFTHHFSKSLVVNYEHAYVLKFRGGGYMISNFRPKKDETNQKYFL